MHADLGLREQIAALLMSYKEEWLRLGLEVMFGESVAGDLLAKPRVAAASGTSDPVADPPSTADSSVASAASVSASTALRRSSMAAKKSLISKGKSPTTRTHLALKKFVVDRVLGDPAILAKYTQGRQCRVPSGNFERLYKAELRGASLHRMVVLVAFLDAARASNGGRGVLDGVPCLFKIGAGVKSAKSTSDVKSTKQILVALCRDFLKGEGDFVKHLSQLGLEVSYEQKYIDEYDFQVKDLEVDLRDGVRLCRMAEILTGGPGKSLSLQLRVPAVSRLQKLHNVNLALTSLSSSGVALSGLSARDVVDGNRGGVLALLWRCLVRFRLGKLVNVDVLKQEIKDVQRASSRRKILGVSYSPPPASSVTPQETALTQETELTSLLLQWSREVCATFGVSVLNFTTSFADGKALCLLLHYYHPGSLARSEIHHPTTTDLKGGSNELPSAVTAAEYDQAVRNEQRNVLLAKKRMSDLGGIPSMLAAFDSTAVPEEKSVVGCVAYLCSRLMESSKEIQATLVIQRAWGRYYGLFLLGKKAEQAKTIWAFWKKHKVGLWSRRQQKLGGAVKTIEKFILRSKSRRAEVKEQRTERARWARAASTIARAFRCAAARRLLQELDGDRVALLGRAATVIQTRARRRLARAAAGGRLLAVLTVQAAARGARVRGTLRRYHAAATRIQSILRMSSAQLGIVLRMMAATRIQRVARGAQGRGLAAARLMMIEETFQIFLAQQAAEIAQQAAEVDACVRIQAAMRGKLARIFLAQQAAKVNACVLIQAHMRGKLQRIAMFYNHLAATILQSAQRCRQGSAQYRRLLRGAVLLQSLARARAAGASFSALKEAAAKIQARARRNSARKKEEETAAATFIQKRARGRRARAGTVGGDFSLFRAGCGTIQRAFRSAVARGTLAELRKEKSRLRAAGAVQRAFRSAVARSTLEELRKENSRLRAAVTVQRAFRSSAARRTLAELKDEFSQLQEFCATVIQRAVRGQLARAEHGKMQSAASTIQDQWRSLIFARTVQADYQSSRNSAIEIQAAVRKFAARSYFAEMKAAATRIQGVTRGNSVRAEMELSNYAASEVQRMFRGCQQQIKYVSALLAIIKIQTALRTNLARKEFSETKEAAKVVQKFWRNVKLARGEREETSAVVLQKFARKAKGRQAFLEMRKGTVAVQRVARGCMQRRENARRAAGAVKVQAVFRKFAARAHLAEMKAAATRIQGVTRGNSVRAEMELRNYAASEIQRMFRGCQQQIKYVSALLAVIKIQSVLRMDHARTEFQLAGMAVRILQKFWRNVLVAKEETAVLAAREESAVKVQAAVRLFVQRAKLFKLAGAAVKVQAVARKRLVTARLAKCRTGFSRLQGIVRGMMARQVLEFHGFVATILQKMVRSALARKHFCVLVNGFVRLQSIARRRNVETEMQLAGSAATIIEKLVRGHLGRREGKRRRKEKVAGKVEELTRQNNARRIQGAAREFLRRTQMERAGARIVRVARGMLGRKKFSRCFRLVTNLQAICRGRKTRKFTDKKMRVIRMKIGLANRNAREQPGMKLGERCLIALDTLLNSKR